MLSISLRRLSSQVATASCVQNFAQLGFVLIPAQLITGLMHEDKDKIININKMKLITSSDFISTPLVEVDLGDYHATAG